MSKRTVSPKPKPRKKPEPPPRNWLADALTHIDHCRVLLASGFAHAVQTDDDCASQMLSELHSSLGDVEDAIQDHERELLGRVPS